MLFLTNEVLHKAKESGQDFLLLKLDTIKAFDCVGWVFLLKLLETVGFGPKFLNVLTSINKSASSSIMLNGRFTTPIKLEHSLRQGCPCSPLLYLIIVNALSKMLTHTSDLGDIRGVHIPKIDDQIHHA